MKKLAIDRFEGTYAICEDQEKRMFAIALNELPEGAKEGDVPRSATRGSFPLT